MYFHDNNLYCVLYLYYRYRFVAVIAFVESVEGSLAHYITYCKRLHGHWEYHDDLSLRVTKCKENKKIKPHTMLFTREH